MKIILPESKILLLKEYIVNPQSTDLNSGSRMYFAIFEGDILFYNSNNGSSVIDFVNKHSNDFGKAYFIFKSNFNKISYGSNGVNSFTELLGSFFPKLVTGTIFPSTRSIVLNYNKNYDVKRSNEVYKLMKMPQLQGYSFSLVKGNRNSSSPLSKNYALRKKDDNYPTKFYHGTVLQFADLILKQGLKPGGKKSNWRVKHDRTVFITSEFSLAKKFARATSERNGGIPCVLEVNASKLDTSLFAFDYDIYNTYTDANFDSDYEKSKQVAHINGAKYHKASPIKSTADPRSYIKVGYRGIILPSMFTKIYIDYPTKRVALTPQEYLKKNMNESVEDDEYMIGAEGDGGNNEYFHIEENQEQEVNADEVKLDSFKAEDHLVPKIWKGMMLSSKVRLKLLDIADDFWDTCNLDWVKLRGIHLTGSICNFNWSKFSDIDLHLVVDFSDVSKRKDFVQQYFDAKKNEWNNEHENLKIYGFPVELYVEDINAKTESGGLFNLETNAWIKAPSPDDVHSIELGKYEIKEKSAVIMTKIDNYYDLLNSTTDDAKLRKLGDKAHRLLKKIKAMRKFGLKRGGEGDPYNIVYKVLRRTEYLDKLWSISSKLYDKLNSIG